MRILVVEDDAFVAIETESVIEECGYQCVGIATDARSAVSLAAHADAAIVDLNLKDGCSGATLGQSLSEDFGLTVVFMTANPNQLGQGIPGTLGVMGKPVRQSELIELVEFVASHCAAQKALPPERMVLFNPPTR